MITAGLNNLCEPAFFYFVISFSIVFVVALQNYGQGYNYCVGTQSCSSANVPGLFVIKVLYILVWTWILNLICKNGYEPLSWALVFIPIILMFIFMAIFISNQYDFGLLFRLPNLFN